jgi:NTE family protein
MSLMPVVAKQTHISLALGGGGARGLAHILVLEAFDEFGIKPARIAGTSAGALFGAAYASGLPAKLIRAHTEEVLGQRFDLVRQIFAARAQPFSKFLSLVPLRNALLDPEALLEAVLPSGVARTFEALAIPLTTVSCDFYAQSEVLHSHGELRPAIAASMALPIVFTPVMLEGRALVDGGFVNPLPFDVLADASHITVAIDVSGGAPDDCAAVTLRATPRAQPSAVDVMAASSQILQRSIVREKLKRVQPDILIECPVDDFSVMDFHRWREVLVAAAPVKEKLKRQLDRVLRAVPLPLIPNT